MERGYIEWVEVSSWSHAAISEVALHVDVESVVAGEKSADLATD